MNKLALTFATATTLFAASAFAAPTTWDIDPAHSVATFAIKHLAVSTVRGEFGKMSGTVTMEGTDLKTAKIDVSIDPSTINTREPKRDTHLKSPDFFDVAKFPTITFKSTKVEAAAGGTFKITGDLTMHGVTKSVTLDTQPLSAQVKSPMGFMATGTSATAKVTRKDFGITGGGAGMMVGDDVNITIDVELDNKKSAPAKK